MAAPRRRLTAAQKKTIASAGAVKAAITRRANKERRLLSEPRAVGRPTKTVTVRDLEIEKRENKLPNIGYDLDHDLTTRKLINASAKFLKLLHVEKLRAIRNGVVPNEA